MSPRLAALGLALTLMAGTGAAFAEDRAPTAEERTRIEGALRSQGFNDWGRIELDDGIWKIDDARGGQSDRRRDIHLTPDDLRLIDTSIPDRDATPEERGRIEQALRAQGFTAFGDIELDDGVWEVDNARHSDGNLYDLKLERESLRILHREQDNDGRRRG